MEVFEIEFICTVRIEIDPSLEPDDEWRAKFFPIYDLEGMAKHIAWNRAIKKFPNVDGVAPEDHAKYEIASVEWSSLS